MGRVTERPEQCRSVKVCCDGEQTAQQCHIDRLPDSGAHPVVHLCAEVLGNKGVGVTDGPDKIADQRKVGQPCRKGGGHGLFGKILKHQPVRKEVDAVACIGEDQGQGDPEDCPEIARLGTVEDVAFK